MYFTSSKIFYLACLAFILSIGFCTLFSVSTPLILFFIISGTGLVVFSWPEKKIGFTWSQSQIKVVAVGFVLIAFALGCWRFYFWQQQNISQLATFNDQSEVAFEGWIVEQKTKTPKSNQFVLQVEKIIFDNQARESSGRVLLILPPHADFKPGDLLQVEGKLQTPQSDQAEGFFSYQKYLAKDGIYSSSVFPQTEKIGFVNKKPITFFLFKVKDAFKNKLSRALPQPQLSFLNGLVLGEKTGMSLELKDDFVRTGTSHLVALSGFNITIIAQSLAALFLFFGLSRKKVFWLTLVVIFAFVLMVGAGSSIVRAAIMGLLFLYAKKEGRLYGARNAILLAGVLMLWFDPNDLVFDVGFQLSFLATLGLVYLTPIFSKVFSKTPEFFGFKESLISTLAAQIFVLPVLIFYFQSLSLISPLVNILVLPFIPITMLFGFLTASLSFLWTFGGQLFGWLAWIFLTYELGVINFFAGFSFSLIPIKVTIPLIIFLYYLAMGLFIWWWRRKKHQKFIKERNEILASLN